MAKGSRSGGTDGVAAGERLRDSAHMEAIFDALGDAVISIDAQGCVVKANAAANRLAGLDPIGLDGATALERLHIRHPDGRRFERAELPDARALRGDAVSGERLVFTDASGHSRMVILHAAPISNGGSISGAVMVMQDVTEAERLVDRLDRANRELSALQGITEAALVAREAGAVPGQLLERLVLATRADAAAILLKEADRLVVRFSIGLGDEVKAHCSVAVGEGFAGTIAASREPLHLLDVQNDPLVQSEIVRPLGIRSMLGVPLIARDELVGVLHLDWLEEHDVTDAEVRFLQVAAERVAMVVAHGRLREEGDNLLRRIEAIMENTEAHLAYLDRNLDFVMVNETYARGSGRTKEELIGRNHFELFPHEENEVIFKRCRDTGEPVEFRAKPFEFPGDPTRGTTYWDWTLAPVKEEDGTVEGLVLSLEEVTDRIRRQQLSDALNEVNKAINSTLDRHEIMQRVVDGGASALGTESGGIWLREKDDWVLTYATGQLESFVGMVEQMARTPVPTDAARRGEVVNIDDTLNDPRPNHARMKRLGFRAMLVLPLKVRDEVLGIAQFNFHSGPVEFSEGQCDFARKLAVATSLALENSDLYAKQHEMAEMLQDALRSTPERVKGLKVGHLYRSATAISRIGGDFFDVFETRPGYVNVTLGDVSGKGLKAVALAAFAKNTLKAVAVQHQSPREALTRANEIMARSFPAETFVTVFNATLDLATGRLTYCCAGHPPPLTRSKDGVRALAGGSPLVGAFQQLPFEEHEVLLTPGDILLAFTDGIVEARRGDELYGEERLARAFAALKSGNVAHLPSRLLSEVAKWAGQEPKDDVAILTLTLERRGRRTRS